MSPLSTFFASPGLNYYHLALRSEKKIIIIYNIISINLRFHRDRCSAEIVQNRGNSIKKSDSHIIFCDTHDITHDYFHYIK